MIMYKYPRPDHDDVVDGKTSQARDSDEVVVPSHVAKLIDLPIESPDDASGVAKQRQQSGTATWELCVHTN